MMKVRNDCEIVYLARAYNPYKMCISQIFEAYNVVMKFFASIFFPFMHTHTYTLPYIRGEKFL